MFSYSFIDGWYVHVARGKKMVQLKDRGRMWKSKWIKDYFEIKQAQFTKIRGLIRENPQRYSQYSIIDDKTDVLSFADAKTFKSKLIKGEDLPPFKPDEIARMIGIK